MKVVTFGELMLRLAPEGYTRFVQAETFGATYGGGEANVAVSLANFGLNAAFVTKLPAHEIGQAAVNSLRRYGEDTSYITRGGSRVGIYFLEKGASQRPCDGAGHPDRVGHVVDGQRPLPVPAPLAKPYQVQGEALVGDPVGEKRQPALPDSLEAHGEVSS